MSKKVLIILIIVIAVVFLVARVVGKKGIKELASEAKKPVAESPSIISESKPKTVVSSVTSTPENLPKLRISSDTNQIPQSLSVIMGTGQKTDYFTRIKSVHALGKELFDNEVQALYVLLNRCQRQSENGVNPPV